MALILSHRHCDEYLQTLTPIHGGLVVNASQHVDLEMSSSIPALPGTAEPTGTQPLCGPGHRSTIADSPVFPTTQNVPQHMNPALQNVAVEGVASGSQASGPRLRMPTVAWDAIFAVPASAAARWRIPVVLVFTVPAVVALVAVFAFAWAYIAGTANSSIGEAVALLNLVSAANIKREADGYLLREIVTMSFLHLFVNHLDISSVPSVLATTLLSDNSLTSVAVGYSCGAMVEVTRAHESTTNGYESLLVGTSPCNGTNLTFWRLSPKGSGIGPSVATFPFGARDQPWHLGAVNRSGLALTGPHRQPLVSTAEYVLSFTAGLLHRDDPPMALGVGFDIRSLFDNMLQAYNMLHTSGVLLLLDNGKNVLLASSSMVPTTAELARISLVTTSVDVQTGTLQNFGSSFILVVAVGGVENGRGVAVPKNVFFAAVIIPRSDYFGLIDRNSRVGMYVCTAMIVAFLVIMGMVSYFSLVKPIHKLVNRLRAVHDALRSGSAPQPSDNHNSWIKEICMLSHATAETIRAAEAAAASRAREVAEARRRAKDTFFAMISHEMRTPLNGILGMIRVLLHTELSERQQECAEAVHANGDSLLALVNDLLDFSKLENDSLVLESIPFDVRQCIAKTVQVVQLKAEEKEIELICHVSSAAALQSTGDPARVSQVLLNLLSNAVKFTPKGGSIIMKCSPGESSQLRFEVKDTGIGLDAAAMERLFQPFVQADASISRKYGGSGLGVFSI